MLVSAYLRAGEIEAGLAPVSEVLAHIERTGDREAESLLWLQRGQLILGLQNATTLPRRLPPDNTMTYASPPAPAPETSMVER
jgi:hypothetical protein